MAATIGPFRYPDLSEPTQWIRVLHLEPSTRPDAPFRGRLVETRLDTHTDYHAVSYVWGDTNAPFTDSLELQTATTQAPDAGHDYARLPIRASCSTVLRHLRWAKKTRALWIDAICINQSNTVEKSYQVCIMQFIYRDASKVAMWLDLSHVSAHQCKGVFKRARMLSYAYRWGFVSIFDDEKGVKSAPFRSGRRFVQSLRLRFGRYKWLYSALSLERITEETLLSILDSPYFGRTWTVQELVMASLGNIEMNSSLGTVQWAHILALVEFRFKRILLNNRDARILRVHRRLSCRGSFNEDKTLFRNSLKESMMRSENRLIDLWHAEGSVYPFSDIPYLLASDPRDKAYAFLWALERCRPVEKFDIFNVDYTKTVETVYTEFTIAVAHETGDFLSLFQSACEQDKISTLPSWVPDWSKEILFEEWNFLTTLRAQITMNRIEHLHLSGQETAQWPQFQNSTMHIRGLRQADRVSRLERVPISSSTDSLTGGIFLHHYSPRVIETLCIALHNIFQMLDDAGDLACLTKHYIRAFEAPPVDQEAPECLVPGALDRPETLHYTILRGIIRSYVQAKRSPDPSDVDVDEWSRGLTAEFRNLLTEETLESLLLELSSCEDYQHVTLNAWGIEAHIVTDLIQCSTFFTRGVIMDWELMHFASGKMGATIFKTEGGSLGFGQANIDVGDEVVQWTGVPRPTVVRMLDPGIFPESQPEEYRCRLISVAAVDGIAMTEEDWREEDLVTYNVV